MSKNFYIVRAVLSKEVLVEAESEMEAETLAEEVFIFEGGYQEFNVVKELETEEEIERAKRLADERI